VKKVALLKKRQLKELNREDIQKRLGELRLELAKEKGQIAIGGTPTNPGKVKEIKRTIARILTELNKRGKK